MPLKQDNEQDDEILLSSILVIEGTDDRDFFTALLEHEHISGCQIFKVDGKANFNKKIQAIIQMRGFNKVETAAVIRDADDNPASAFQSIKDIFLRNSELIPPDQPQTFSNRKPRIGIFIIPNDSTNGMLEDLCLKTIQSAPEMECVDKFIECVNSLEYPPKNIAKAKAQAYLAAKPEIANTVGIGAKKNYWNFDSEELSELKSFLNNLR